VGRVCLPENDIVTDLLLRYILYLGDYQPLRSKKQALERRR
jgi:hypothetical protein